MSHTVSSKQPAQHVNQGFCLLHREDACMHEYVAPSQCMLLMSVLNGMRLTFSKKREGITNERQQCSYAGCGSYTMDDAWHVARCCMHVTAVLQEQSLHAPWPRLGGRTCPRGAQGPQTPCVYAAGILHAVVEAQYVNIFSPQSTQSTFPLTTRPPQHTGQAGWGALQDISWLSYQKQAQHI